MFNFSFDRLAPLIIPIGPDVEVLLDLVELGVHVFDLLANPTAIVVLNATLEHAVEPRRLIANVLVAIIDAAVSAVGAHFAPHMLHHSVEVFDFAVQPADRIRILPAVRPATVVKPWTAVFVNRFLRTWLFDTLVVVMRGGLERETSQAENRSGGKSNKFFHISFGCGRFDAMNRPCIQIGSRAQSGFSRRP